MPFPPNQHQFNGFPHPPGYQAPYYGPQPPPQPPPPMPFSPFLAPPQQQQQPFFPIGLNANVSQGNNGLARLELDLPSIEHVPPMLWTAPANPGGLPMPWNGPVFPPMMTPGPLGTQLPPAYPPGGLIPGWELESIVEPGISGSLVRYFSSSASTSAAPTSGPGNALNGNFPPFAQGQLPQALPYPLEPTGNWMTQSSSFPQPPPEMPTSLFPQQPLREPNARFQSRQGHPVRNDQNLSGFGNHEAFRRHKTRRSREFHRARQSQLADRNTRSQETNDKENQEPETGRSLPQAEEVDSGFEMTRRLWSSDMEEEHKEEEMEAEKAVQLTVSTTAEHDRDDGQQASSSQPNLSLNPCAESAQKYAKKAENCGSRGPVVDNIVKEMVDHGFTHSIKGKEFPFVSNVWNSRVVNEIKFPAKNFSYYVPPRVDDDDFFGGQIHIWHELMMKCFSSYFPDVWHLQGLPDFEKSTVGWYHLTATAKLRFCCRECSRPWTSMRGKIHFALKLVPRQGRGVIFMKIFGQVCIQDSCSDNTFQTPACYPEEINRLLRKLQNFVGSCYYGLPYTPEFEDQSLNQSFRAGNPGSPHRPELCQACQQGVCSRSRPASA